MGPYTEIRTVIRERIDDHADMSKLVRALYGPYAQNIKRSVLRKEDQKVHAEIRTECRTEEGPMGSHVD